MVLTSFALSERRLQAFISQQKVWTFALLQNRNSLTDGWVLGGIHVLQNKVACLAYV